MSERRTPVSSDGRAQKIVADCVRTISERLRAQGSPHAEEFDEKIRAGIRIQDIFLWLYEEERRGEVNNIGDVMRTLYDWIH